MVYNYRVAALEFGPKQIRVNAVNPTVTMTAMAKVFSIELFDSMIKIHVFRLVGQTQQKLNLCWLKYLWEDLLRWRMLSTALCFF